jgi:glycosyltransferase involved in cell wall biosynthesis
MKVRNRGADAVAEAERQHGRTDALTRASGWHSVVEEPVMCKSFLGGNREITPMSVRGKRFGPDRKAAGEARVKDNVGYVCALNGRRDYYQLPLALAEGGILDRFVTDAYLRNFPQIVTQALPPAFKEKLRARREPGIPDDRVVSIWSVAVEQQLWRRFGRPDWKIFARLDRRISMAAARRAKKGRSNLFLYHPYAWEAFRAKYRHDPRKILFQFHPHADLERRILAGDGQKDLCRYSYEEEAGEHGGAGLKRRTNDSWRYADLIFCASAFTKRSLVEAGADAGRCLIVPYGIDLPEPDNDIGAPEAFRVLFVGSGIQRKGLHYLLLAWRKAVLPPNSRLTVVCRSIDRGLNQLLRSVNNVELVRGVSHNTLQQLFRTSCVMAMPSLVEGFGQVYLEALAQGCPVLGTANTCLPDIGPSPAIYLVSAAAIDQLVAQLEKLSLVLPGNHAVRTEARACAARWPWMQFRAAVRSALNA